MKYKEYFIEYINKRTKKYQNENYFEINNKAINDVEDINEPLNKKENNKQMTIKRKEQLISLLRIARSGTCPAARIIK